MKQSKNLRAWRLATVAVLVALAGGLVPSVGAQEEPPLIDLALGTPYESNFNDDNGGFEASPVPPPPPTTTWEHGAPTSGPGFAFSGSNVWATELDGPYMGNDCGLILSPPISIPSGATASVGFQEWRHLETSSTLAWDAGLLFVSTDGGASYTKVTPDIGYTSATMSSTSRSCLFGQPSGTKGLSGPVGTTPPPAAYAPVTTDVSGFAGQTIQFAIAFGSDSSVHREGWYIDDFTVTINSIPTVEDFESGNGGFTAVSLGTPKSPLGWEHGEATVGPAGAANLDGNVWATNLDGEYGYEECAELTSPEIDLGSIPEGLLATEATLRWQQWYQTSSFSAGGVVQVDAGDGFQTITPVGGYPEDAVSSTLEDCLGVDSPAFDGTLQADGADLADYEADLTPFIGSTVQVRFLFASSTSSPFGEGWYIDNLGVDLALVVAGVGIPEPPAPPDPSQINPDALQNWTSGGVESSWEYGTAVEAGGPDGETGWVTNLDGDHNANECSYVESPAVLGAHVSADPTLVFDHWYIIGSAFSTGGSAFDAGALFVSTDLGASWQHMVLPEYTTTSTGTVIEDCFGAGNDAPGFLGNKSTMDTVTVDLSSLVGSPTVKFRWVIATTSVVHNEGWFFKNVKVGGQQLLP